MRRSLVSFVLLLVLLTGGCWSGSVEKMDVSNQTFEDATQRAFDAINRPGEIFHVKTTLTANGRSVHGETWVDTDRQVAREDFEGQPAHILTHDCDVTRREGREGFGGKLRASPRSPLGAAALQYLETLEAQEPSVRELAGTAVGGRPAIRLRLSGEHTGDFAGKYTNDVFLSEEYLPLRTEYKTRLFATFVETYASEFLPRESLPAEFFSISVLPDEAASTHGPACVVAN